MQNIFVNIFLLFNRKKWLFITVLLSIAAFIVFFVSRIHLEEDIRAIIPQDDRISNVNLVLNNSKFSDQIILNFSSKDSNTCQPKLLKSEAEKLVSILEKDTNRIKKIRFKVQEDSFQDIYEFFYQNLPLYLSDADYDVIEQKLNDKAIAKTLRKNFKSLISPAGIATKKYIFKDPLSITPLALEKLKNFQLDDNFLLYESCVFTKDKQNLLVFIEPKYSSSDIDKNKLLIDSLDQAILRTITASSPVNVEYYGGTAVAVANAKRIKTDIMLTVNIAIAFILILFFFVFRQVKILLLLFIPVILGAGIAIALISILTGSISAIALGVGAILVGISIDYSLHFFTHFRSSGSITETLKDISLPILMSAGTTASAFLCLFIIKSEALNQLGMFGAFSIVFAALSVLLFIPVFFSKKDTAKEKSRNTILDKIAAYELHKNKIVILLILILSIGFLFTFKNIGFNSDISKLNYLPPHLKEAEQNLTEISSETQSAVYLISVGNSLQEALEKSESKSNILDKAKEKHLFASMSSGTDLLLTKEKQIERIEKWNSFWQRVGRKNIENLLKNNSTRFKDEAFNSFYQLINKTYTPLSIDAFDVLQKSFLSNYINKSNNMYSVISILKVAHKDKAELFAMFDGDDKTIIFDKQYFSNQFFDVLKDDFNILVWLSMGIVFLILLISFGRIELALISFTPIALSWLWTLGLMGLFGIEFNIFNIIISTFIFGLGIDYSIFIMKGLMDNYRYGNKPLTPYKLSILLSVITTILGMGVLIFAEHPALKSIALVSIFGIASVVIISYTIIPLMFNAMTMQKGKLRSEPFNLFNSVISVVTFLIFFVNSITLTSFIPIVYILPIPRRWVKYVFHTLICWTSRFIVWINFHIIKTEEGKEHLDFSKPSVLVSNHQSHLDLVLLLRVNPKIVVVTNKWVWNSPFFGFIVRFAGYFPVYDGIDRDFNKIKEKVAEGYSILVFPEGTRTKDGSIKRYHQGAFKIADELGLDIQPILIHGAFESLPKTEFFMRSGDITVKFFERIKVKSVNADNNETYREQAKDLMKLVRKEFDILRKEKETTKFYKNKLINQYLYKGPVTEWYVKVKLRMENYFSFYHEIIPREAKIVDIGCGLGYISYLLKYTSPKREILGLDYDAEKIATAKNIIKDNKGIDFKVADITKDEFPDADVYLITDVLHYFPEELQIKVLEKCMSKLSDNGMIIIRDADADLEERTKVTRQTEINSTKIFKFNKIEYELSFTSSKTISRLAEANGFNFKRVDNAKRTANINYILSRK